MKTAVVRIVAAFALFAVGAACWTEARLTRRVVDAYQRFDTLQYDSEDGIDENATTLSRLLWPVSMLREGVMQHRTHVSYWRGEYETATAEAAAPPPAPPSPAAPGTAGTQADSAAGATELFTAANGAFRGTQRFSGDRAVAVERLDKVMQAYAEVLRADSGNADASFNYEYVARYRDGVARGRGPGSPPERGPDNGEADFGDLPSGPTIHGRPGAPPPDLPVEEFKTLVPMPQEESQEKPGEGTMRRRG